MISIIKHSIIIAKSIIATREDNFEKDIKKIEMKHLGFFILEETFTLIIEDNTLRCHENHANM